MKPINDDDIREVSKVVNSIVGKKAWGVKLGHGTFLTIEFGKPVTDESNQTEHGEWHFWIYCCSWRIEKAGQIVLGCEDSKAKIEMFLQKLENAVLRSFEANLPLGDATLKFDHGLTLKLFTINTEDEDQWMLFTPSGKVLVMGPGGQWKYEAS